MNSFKKVMAEHGSAIQKAEYMTKVQKNRMNKFMCVGLASLAGILAAPSLPIWVAATGIYAASTAGYVKALRANQTVDEFYNEPSAKQKVLGVISSLREKAFGVKNTNTKKMDI